MTHDLTILTPSRGRPKNAVRMYEAFRETCTADTKLIIIVDRDDATLSTYYRLLNGVGQVTAVEPGRRGMVAALQAGYLEHRDQLGFAVGFFGDDHLARTVGWDDVYLNNLRELGSGFVYGDDLFQHEAIPTQIAMTSDIPAALGYMCPPEFDHLCVDVVWNDWGKAIEKIRYLPHVVVEHVHYLAGKAQKDVTYSEVNSGAMAAHDSAAYQEYLRGNFNSDIKKLQALVAPKNKSVPVPVEVDIPVVEVISESALTPEVEIEISPPKPAKPEVVVVERDTARAKRGRPTKKVITEE